ncbi:unnamed protein product [Dovyalis caffra]|uniref:Uncharacterized protein n=1 Tax=Dovyalis caffra TaxID=77055 RepID=A0AAV1QPG9_9ROSI|nr:unnamed protein product [Dovyalis caffra]
MMRTNRRRIKIAIESGASREIRSWERKEKPLVGGLMRFLKGPIVMLREEHQKLGSVFTMNLVNRKITFLIGPEVSTHFFNALEVDLSQQEVYQFNVPTFGHGVVFDVDYSIRQEQFRFFIASLRVNKLKGYVDQMVVSLIERQEQLFDFFSALGDVAFAYAGHNVVLEI